MSDILERALYFAIGGAFGFVLGYIVAHLRKIEREVHEVLDIEKRNIGDLPPRKPRDEDGVMKPMSGKNLLLFVVVAIVAYSAFASQRASNGVQQTQSDLIQISLCNQEFLGKTIMALNERTTFVSDQANANVELQRAQAEFLAIVIDDSPEGERAEDDALRRYFSALTEFIQVNTKTAEKADNNPYPTSEDLTGCLEGEQDE